MDQPWFVDPETGHTLTGREAKARTDAIACGLGDLLARLGSFPPVTAAHLDFGIRDVIAIISPNCLDFGPIVWASHKVGCTVASISGGSTVDEMA